MENSVSWEVKMRRTKVTHHHVWCEEPASKPPIRPHPEVGPTYKMCIEGPTYNQGPTCWSLLPCVLAFVLS